MAILRRQEYISAREAANRLQVNEVRLDKGVLLFLASCE